MDRTKRENFFLEQEEKLLIGGVAFSEWCTFVSKSVYNAFVNGADLATVITAVVCIETYYRTENPESRNKSLSQLIDEASFLSEEDKNQLQMLRKYRNGWVHADCLDDTKVLEDEDKYLQELESMSFLAVRMLLTVLFSCPYI